MSELVERLVAKGISREALEGIEDKSLRSIAKSLGVPLPPPVRPEPEVFENTPKGSATSQKFVRLAGFYYTTDKGAQRKTRPLQLAADHVDEAIADLMKAKAMLDQD